MELGDGSDLFFVVTTEVFVELLELISVELCGEVVDVVASLVLMRSSMYSNSSSFSLSCSWRRSSRFSVMYGQGPSKASVAVLLFLK